jgi:hypothetical protein
MHGPISFAYRRNSDGSYDSICLRCYATAASARKDESLSSSESAHVCDPSALDRVNQGSIPEGTPMSGLVEWSSSAGADESRPTRHPEFPIQTKLRLTIKPARAN